LLFFALFLLRIVLRKEWLAALATLALYGSVIVARSIRIRFGLITAPFRGSVRHFWTESQEFRVTSSMHPTPASVAESRSVQEWLRRGRELRARTFIDAC